MKHIFVVLMLIFSFKNVFAEQKPPCRAFPYWFQPICQRLYQIVAEGDTDLYLPVYTWHNRYKYSADRIDAYNELPLGAGFGKSLFDENGNWQGLYAMAFEDSHSNIEPVVGYAFLKIFTPKPEAKLGIGFTVLVTGRPDIFGGIPFPGALPWASISYRQISLAGTYIPGSHGAGNILFLVVKINLSDL